MTPPLNHALAAKALRDDKVRLAHMEYADWLRQEIIYEGRGIVAVARDLGITRQSLYEYLQRYPAIPIVPVKPKPVSSTQEEETTTT